MTNRRNWLRLGHHGINQRLPSSRLVLLLVVAIFAGSASAIIIRHDVDPEAYTVAATDYPAVFFLERQGSSPVCAATLIHPRWAITAAHCTEETTVANAIDNGLFFAVEVAGSIRLIDAISIHPDYDQQSATDVDLALLRFREPLTGTQPVALQTIADEEGDIVSLVGWGFFGFGTTGRQYSDGIMRRATNRISAAGQRLHIVFEDPRRAGTESLPLEGVPGLWDSGGPALLESDAGITLLGIAIGEVQGEDYSEETQGKYGAEAVYERISSHIRWIEAIVGNEYPFDS